MTAPLDVPTTLGDALSQEMAQKVEIIGNATLYLGCCSRVVPTLDLNGTLISDPPYGIGTKYKTKPSIQAHLEWEKHG